MKKGIILGIVLIAIVGVIIYFQNISQEGALTEEELKEAEIQIPVNQGNEETMVESSDTEETNYIRDPERIKEKEGKYETPKELVGISGYINTEEGFKISDYIGKKVILVDFWTYSCINCQRTLPYINAWHDKYKDEGLLIVGVHTPEFEFEKEYENVLKAVEKYEIEYPVVQDNDKKTFRAYENRYWPRKYLIDIDGFIVYDHIGEGRYQETEDNIRRALNERKEILQEGEEIVRDYVQPGSENPVFFKIGTRETYFGYKYKKDQFGNGEWVPEKTVEYTLPDEFEKNLFYLDGEWRNNPDNMELVSDEGKVVLRYFAKNVNVVAGSDSEQEIKVIVDGEVNNELINDESLYNIVKGEDYEEHLLEIEAKKGFRIYTFTFG